MSKRSVTILGLNGHIGQAAATAFAAAGWDVTGMARSERKPLASVRFVAGDAANPDDIRRAIGDSEVVFYALNLPYAEWFGGAKERQLQVVLDVLAGSGKTLLFPGNIYNYSASDRVVTPDLPQRPQTPRGAVRVRMEQMLAAAADRGDMQVIILRAGDFFGPPNERDWFEYVMMKGINAGKAQVMGLPGIRHAWAYLPDLGRAFEALASMRTSLGAFESFHFAGHFISGDEMGQAIEAAVGRKLRISRFPLIFIKLAGLFDPTMREVSKMDYLWRNTMELRDERLDALLGPGFGTPLNSAVAASVAPCLEGPLAVSLQLPAQSRV